MTLPEPELTDEFERVLAGVEEEIVRGEWHGAGVKDAAAESDKRDDQDELDWVGEVIRDLRGGDVESEDEGQGEAGDGGRSDEGIDADEEAGGEAPSEPLRSGSAAEQREDGEGDAAVCPVVVRDGFWLCHIQSHS